MDCHNILVKSLECDGGEKSPGYSGLDVGSVLTHGDLGKNALTHAKHPITMYDHDRSNSSHFEMQWWLWRKRKFKNRNERKSAHGQLRCSTTDNTHPTLEPWRRGDARLRSVRLILTTTVMTHWWMKREAHDVNVTVELACALHPSANWTRQEAEKAKNGSHYLLAICK